MILCFKRRQPVQHGVEFLVSKVEREKKELEVINKFIDIFLKVHPKSELPNWFSNRVSPVVSERKKEWQVSLTAAEQPREPYSPVITDENGNKMYVIANSYKEIVLFSVVFQKYDLSWEIVKDTDLSQIDENGLVHLDGAWFSTPIKDQKP